MCHLNYTKEKKEYKHITYTERTMIERWNSKDKKSKKEISELLNKSERTIRRELKIGSNIEIIKRIERMIKEEKKSPEVIEYE